MEITIRCAARRFEQIYSLKDERLDGIVKFVSSLCDRDKARKEITERAAKRTLRVTDSDLETFRDLF